MRILKNHKMYVRPDKKNDSVRSLAKLSPTLYVFVYERFQKGSAQQQYSELNKNVKDWRDWRPLDFRLSAELSKELERITKKDQLTVYYNGTWRPLVTLHKVKKG